MQGVTDALDVATDGLCRRGAVILLEDYRLRHTFATILGADLSITDDPLLPGYFGPAPTRSSATRCFSAMNTAPEFLSLFADAIQHGPRAGAGGRVLREPGQSPDGLRPRPGRDRRSAARAAGGRTGEAGPRRRHLSAGVAAVSRRHGLAARRQHLPGAGRRRARWRASTTARSAATRSSPTCASLDPRLEDARALDSFASPIARISGPSVAPENTPIALDASASTAAAGHRLTNFHWTLVSGPH